MHSSFVVKGCDVNNAAGRDGFVATLELVGLGDELTRINVFIRRTRNMDVATASREAERMFRQWCKDLPQRAAPTRGLSFDQ